MEKSKRVERTRVRRVGDAWAKQAFTSSESIALLQRHTYDASLSSCKRVERTRVRRVGDAWEAGTHRIIAATLTTRAFLHVLGTARLIVREGPVDFVDAVEAGLRGDSRELNGSGCSGHCAIRIRCSNVLEMV
jgi:hypothetical protein